MKFESSQCKNDGFLRAMYSLKVWFNDIPTSEGFWWFAWHAPLETKQLAAFSVYVKMCIKGVAAAAAKSLQSCPTLCDPIDSSPPGSPVPGILQARTPEWVAISCSNAGKWKVKVKSLSRVWLFGTPWTAAHQASPSMGFSRQECWSGVPLPSPLREWDIAKRACFFAVRVQYDSREYIY